MLFFDHKLHHGAVLSGAVLDLQGLALDRVEEVPELIL